MTANSVVMHEHNNSPLNSMVHLLMFLLITSNTCTEKGTTETATSQALMFEISLDFVLLINPLNPNLFDV